jgi:response regulator RpfG family c-di-GMP phosphodiesterase
MDIKRTASNITLDFLQEDSPKTPLLHGSYKVLIADDDHEVHSITKIILKDMTFEGKSLYFLDAYSGKEAITCLEAHPDVALLFLDVVMEDSHAGLTVVEDLRKRLKNTMTRIVLRTGQPGEAPEESVIRDYDINDYRLKTEMTVKRLHTTVYSALRNYRDLHLLDRHKKGLEKIIETSANLFKHNTLTDFLTSILEQLSGFYHENSEILYIREQPSLDEAGGFVTLDHSDVPTIVAATGKYSYLVGKPLTGIVELQAISKWMADSNMSTNSIEYIGSGFIIKNTGKNHLNNYIYIEGDSRLYDFELIKLFLSNYSVALDNYILNNMIHSTQKEIIITLGEVVEKHFYETAGHVRRISDMMYEFALLNNFSYAECEVLKIASSMHDIGKIAIPDHILKKPGRLTPEEFEIIKEHAETGYKILSKSDLDILQVAAQIALNHHERFDGTGYPSGIKGRSIPLYARMLAIVDVFDAMTHRRIYKEASPVQEAIDYITLQKGKHFDPNLTVLFLENLPNIIGTQDSMTE